MNEINPEVMYKTYVVDCLEEPSIFTSLKGIEYFSFEEDFMEAGIRCIPMIVRFKMDLAGIKLKLTEWVRFSVEQKSRLALMQTNTAFEIFQYRENLESMILMHTGKNPTTIEVPLSAVWENIEQVPEILVIAAYEFGYKLSLAEWQRLTELQRFALLKLVREGHENKNFPKALAEFHIASAK